MGLRQKVFHGLSWLFLSQILKQISQFAITAVLARMLTPNDFGLVGMATLFTGFVTVINETGVSSALIQKRDTTDLHFSSVFWLNILIASLTMAALLSAAPLIGEFFGKRELTPILRVLSISFVIGAFAIVQQTILQKNLDFKKLAIIETIAVVAGGAAGIWSALAGGGAWSLVHQLITFTICQTLLLWAVSGWKPRFAFSASAILDIFRFSAHMTGFNILNYFSRNVDYLLIGKFLGAEALGFYTLAYKLMMYPIQNISWAVSRVLFPAFSKIQAEMDKVRASYLTMIQAISLVTFPMMILLFVVAPELITTVFGERWFPAAELIQILCFCGLIQSITTVSGNIFLSQGKAGLQLKLAVFSTAFVTAAILLGLRWGLTGVAWMYLFYTVIMAYLSLYTLTRVIHLRFMTLHLLIVKIFGYSLGAFAGLYILKLVFDIHFLWSLAFLALPFVLLYFFMVRHTIRGILKKTIPSY